MRSRKYFYYFDDGYYPQDVANMGYNVWDWDASKLDTLFQDSLKTTPVASNSDPVGAWVDGVSGVDAIQSTTANKPTYTTASLNGLQTLSFDGSDALSTGNISISTFAIWVVFRTSSAPRVIYEQSVNPYANDGMGLLSGVTGLNFAIQVRRSGVQTNKFSSSTIANNTYSVFRHEYNNTNASHKLYRDNVNVATAGTSSGDPTGTVTDALYIGARSGVTFPVVGNIAHLCIVSPYPTSAIIANMESYINSKWGIY